MQGASDWKLAAYELIGMSVTLEDHINIVLGLAYARDLAVVVELADTVFATMTFQKRVAMLRAAAPDDGDLQRGLTVAEAIVGLRNSLAHGRLHEHSEARAVFRSTYRGKTKVTVLHASMLPDLTKMHEAALQCLSRASGRIADRDVWARAYGLHPDQRHIE